MQFRRMSPGPTVIALIPARAGSKRIEGKNIRLLEGHPLLAYTIAAALDSGIFSSVLVSTDSETIAGIARYYGAEVPFLRPYELAEDLSPDIEWVRYTLGRLADENRRYDCFSILRPTSPFRQPETIRRAWAQFCEQRDVDSLRAVEKCRQHPGKMWTLHGKRMAPLLSNGPKNPPWHSTPYQALPEIYVQNASLEIAWTRLITQAGTIAGNVLSPFLSMGHEGIDLNEPKDWWYAEHLLKRGDAQLPVMSKEPMRLEAKRPSGNF
jgi:CMP-N,N'-diacetyllegionaminic acid synthase